MAWLNVQDLIFVVLRVFIDGHVHIQYKYTSLVSEGRWMSNIIIPTVLIAEIIVIRGSTRSGPTQISCICYLRVSGCISCRPKANLRYFFIICFQLSVLSKHYRNSNRLCRSWSYLIYLRFIELIIRLIKNWTSLLHILVNCMFIDIDIIFWFI